MKEKLTGGEMKDRASKLQKLANDYELLAKDCLNSRYPQIQQEANKYLSKSQELAQEAKLEAFREQLEDGMN